jgi:hypothetical protein
LTGNFKPTEKVILSERLSITILIMFRNFDSQALHFDISDSPMVYFLNAPFVFISLNENDEKSFF